MSTRLRIVSTIEAITYLVLLGGVVLHRLGGGPDWTPALGPVHGIAFLLYFVVVLHVREDRNWDLQRTVTVLFAAVVPLGGFVVAHRMAAERQSAGVRTATGSVGADSAGGPGSVEA